MLIETLPAVAPATPPLTGLSTKDISWAKALSASCFDTKGLIVEQSNGGEGY